jgi:hypothetical protein
MEPEIDYSIVDTITGKMGIPGAIAAVINCNLEDVQYPNYTVTVDVWTAKVMSVVGDHADIDDVKSCIEKICDRILDQFTGSGCIKGCCVCGPRNQNIRVIYTDDDVWFDDIIYCGIE